MSLHKSVGAVQINTIMTGNYIRKKKKSLEDVLLVPIRKIKKKKRIYNGIKQISNRKSFEMFRTINKS